MAKNTSSSAFRKIDVDQYNEDNYKEEDGGEPQSASAGPDENEITNLLNRGVIFYSLRFRIKSYFLIRLILSLKFCFIKNNLIFQQVKT